MMNTYTHLTLLIDSIPLKYDKNNEEVKVVVSRPLKVKVIKLKSTINNRRKSWL